MSAHVEDRCCTMPIVFLLGASITIFGLRGVDALMLHSHGVQGLTGEASHVEERKYAESFSGAGGRKRGVPVDRLVPRTVKLLISVWKRDEASASSRTKVQASQSARSDSSCLVSRYSVRGLSPIIPSEPGKTPQHFVGDPSST